MMKIVVVLLALTASVLAEEIRGNSGLIQSYAETDQNGNQADFFVEIRNTVIIPPWTRHRCNGVLIDAEWVLAPAVCVKKKPWYGRFVVRIRSKKVGFKQIILHEKANAIDNDVALIRLGEPVEDIPFANLPPHGSNYSGPLTLYTRDKKNNVESFTVGLQENSQCAGAPPLKDIHMCAGDKQNSAVKGQEGSVLVASHPTEGNVLVGLLTWVRKEKEPAVYVRVSSYTRWIMGKITLTRFI